jgi:hypothetical protein
MAVPRDPDDGALRSYLLGLQTEEEAAALEEAYFARADVLERLRAVEDDLLDDYAAGRLEAGDKAAFERRYLASGPLRERVATARALRDAVAQRRPGSAGAAGPSRWGFALGIAAAVVLVVLGASLLPRRPPQSASGSGGVSETPVPSSPAPSLVPGPTPPVGPAASRVAVLALSPVRLRGRDGTAVLQIPARTDEVVLELEGDPGLVPRPGSGFDAAIKTVEGREVWRGEARTGDDARRPSLLAVARVPVGRLAAGDYLLTLSARGAGDDGTLHSYFFRVGAPRPPDPPERTP